ncbi:tubulin-specific chaperone A-like isoform X2 [Limulus polyphemus]|uniref:Tubulin-specific chaperone A n=1 Tax=Limulus polyphemus TaxID=6850 RepID=A0ABM1BSC6_LIMPO|nr:tubulin-specific chaperone A-like isoform X2 [Limulus polyphemus]
MADPRLKQIKIKMGVVKRLSKEKGMYEKEAEQERNKLEKMKAEGKDEYDIRKQEEVLQESLMMAPDCRKRLNIAYTELKSILEAEAELSEQEDYQTAKIVLEDAEKALN